MKYIPTARSPLWPMAIFTLFGVSGFYRLRVGETPDFASPALDVALAISISLMAVMTLLFIVVVRQNNKAGKPISLITPKPIEFRSDDEAYSSFTAETTKAVYAYFYNALPILALIILLATPPVSVIFLLVSVLIVGQYTLFWWKMRQLDNM